MCGPLKPLSEQSSPLQDERLETPASSPPRTPVPSHPAVAGEKTSPHFEHRHQRDAHGTPADSSQTCTPLPPESPIRAKHLASRRASCEPGHDSRDPDAATDGICEDGHRTLLWPPSQTASGQYLADTQIGPCPDSECGVARSNIINLMYFLSVFLLGVALSV